MKKIFSLLLIFFYINTAAIAVDFDDSIDANIRKDYNVEEYNLPALPKAAPGDSVKKTVITQPQYNPTGKIYTIKKGTKILLSSNSAISDLMPKGSKISFTAQYGILSKEGTIIPAGTILKGRITDSHPPQITGNGGLVELCIDEIYFNGIMSKISTKISLANSKKVFLSNIKGKRSYWKNFAKVTSPGRKVFAATQSCANAMSVIPILNLIAFVPLVGGAVVYTVNFVTAPVIAIFTKGGSLKIPAGSEFQIKITEDSQIKG